MAICVSRSCNIYRVFIRYCVFSLSTATHPSPTSLQEISEALNTTQVYCNSHWLANFYRTNGSPVFTRERWQNNEHSWKKTQFFLNILYFTYFGDSFHAYSLTPLPTALKNTPLHSFREQRLKRQVFGPLFENNKTVTITAKKIKDTTEQR